MKIELDLDMKEFEFMLKEHWYKFGKEQAYNYLEERLPKIINEHLVKMDLKQEIRDGIQRCLERFCIRDLKKMEKVYKIKLRK